MCECVRVSLYKEGKYRDSDILTLVGRIDQRKETNQENAAVLLGM